MIFIQARLTSSRFPNKMLADLNGYPLCEYVYRRCANSKMIDRVAVLTSNESSDDKLADMCVGKNIPVYRGDLNNVLDRFVSAADFFGAKYVIRVCGDSPFVDIDLLDDVMANSDILDKYGYILLGNCLNGFMFEIIRADILKSLSAMPDLSDLDREHVTKYIRDRAEQFKCLFLDANLRPKELEKYTLTVDYESDMQIARDICKELKGFDFKSTDIIKILQELKG